LNLKLKKAYSACKSKLIALNYAQRPGWFDWAFAVILFAAASLFFCCSDDLITTAWNVDELIDAIFQGDFFHFYSRALAWALDGSHPLGTQIDYAAYYNIVIYLIFAVCFLPLKAISWAFHTGISSFVFVTYGKLVIAAFVLLCAYFLFRLSGKLGMNRQKSLWTVFLFLSSSTMLFGSVLFGQYDALSSLFTIISLLFFMDKKYYRFCLVMALAICCKVFALFIFIPLILLIEKRILHIIKYLLCGVSGLLFTRFLFLWDEGYAITQKSLNELFGFSDRLFEKGIPGAHGNIGLFLFVFLAVCMFCYFINPPEEKRCSYIISIPVIVYGSFFLFVSWHPQWPMIITPFVALAIMSCRNIKTALLVDFGICAGHIAVAALNGTGCDIYIVNGGILPYIFGEKYRGISFVYLYEKLGLPLVVPATVFAVCLAFFIWLVFYNQYKNNFSGIQAEKTEIDRGILWLRASAILLYIIPSLALYFWELR